MKIESCATCGKEPAYGFYSDDGENNNVTYEVFCYGADCGSKVGSVTAKTYIGAIMRWNAHCRRELRRMKGEGGMTMRKTWKSIKATIRYWIADILSDRCEGCPCIECSIPDRQTGYYDCWCGIFKDEDAVCLLPMFIRKAYAKKREKEELKRAEDMAEFYREQRSMGYPKEDESNE